MAYIFIFLMLFASSANASNCIVDKDNNVVSKISYAPNIKDIESRNEFVVPCSDDIVIGDADYKNNKVVKHIKTKKEIDDATAIEQEKKKINNSRRSAVMKLKTVANLQDDEIEALIK